jgi:hypothetical protein
MSCVDSCGESERGCVFAKALLAHGARCERVERHERAERVVLECTSPVARTNCGTLAALLHERARFALRLPPPGRPLIHLHALKLQCGGLPAIRRALDSDEADVHRLVGLAQERHGSLTELPWSQIVAEIVQWQPARRSRPRT